MGLSKAERKALEAEVISNDARLKLTRLIRHYARPSRGGEDANIGLIRRNQLINIANTVLGDRSIGSSPMTWACTCPRSLPGTRVNSS